MAPGPTGEDCLTLNVYTPSTGRGRRPVMVWFHGGGFVAGSSTQPLYEASRLAVRGDVVVVTANYRLGALGFRPGCSRPRPHRGGRQRRHARSGRGVALGARQRRRVRRRSHQGHDLRRVGGRHVGDDLARDAGCTRPLPARDRAEQVPRRRPARSRTRPRSPTCCSPSSASPRRPSPSCATCRPTISSRRSRRSRPSSAPSCSCRGRRWSTRWVCRSRRPRRSRRASPRTFRS